MLALAPDALSLHNGLGGTPPLGYCSWNDCASEVTEKRIKRVTRALIDTGLAAKGFRHVNVDEGWLASRDADGTMVADRVKFPSGMRALGDWVHAQVVPGHGRVMKYGLYTSRGTCQCSTKIYQAPGSAGHVMRDAAWMAAAGADFVKEDSCCGSQQHDVALREYAEMRDALNATGRPIFFSLCGWNSWYAERGAQLGNSWRIALDGTNWGALSGCVNRNAGLAQFAHPGAWNDPDLLQGTGIGSNDKATNPNGCFDSRQIPQSWNWYLSERQSRAQFSLWAVMSSPLLISADPSQVTPFVLETWSNEEVVAVNQELRPGGPYQGLRLTGGDLHWDPVQGRGSGVNVWGKPLPNGAWALVFVNNGPNVSDIFCDKRCYQSVADTTHRSYNVRDLWARRSVGTFYTPQTLLAKAVEPHGGVAMLRLEQRHTNDPVSRRAWTSEAFKRLPCHVAHPTGEWGGLCRPRKTRRHKAVAPRK